MDDLAGTINSLLSDPSTMQQIQQLAGSLTQGTSGGSTAAPNTGNGANPLAGLDLSALMGMLGGGQSQPSPQPAPQAAPPAASGLNLGSLAGLLGGNSGGSPLGGLLGGGNEGDILQTVMKIAPLLSAFRQEDDNTRLLRALRPLLKEERQKKLDEAAKMLQMMRLLPLLKEQGILKGLLG